MNAITILTMCGKAIPVRSFTVDAITDNHGEPCRGVYNAWRLNRGDRVRLRGEWYVFDKIKEPVS